ncbi:MAG: neutral/alkaline non-lysosomal ceramidase N-terminal domain-containing protein [Acidobacteriota bacterium]|nr:MAG: neutral/alkaline non-lysosomal ceramidase N-terminal domain-containing protein [Acidobacteriota bacterium]
MENARRGVSVALFCLLLQVSVVAGGLRAGTARVEITPPAGHVMGGYANRKGPSTGVHDPLFATVLLLKSDQMTVAMVNCDLRSFPSERVVNEARGRKLADHVLISVTHTHSGPMTWEDQSWPIREHSWFAATEDRILRAIEEASGRLFEARIGSGFGEIYLGHNRRLVEPDGKTTMLWRNADRRPTAPVDPSVGVIRVDDETGTPRAILVNYACHAVVLGPDNLQISADYPGYLARRIESEFPGAVCLFVQGGAGDINPYLDKQPVDQNGFEEAKKMGHALAGEVVRVLKTIKPQAGENGSLDAIAETIEFRDRWDARKSVRTGLTTLLINRRIGIATMPGEPFIELQIALRDKSELPGVFLFGYTYSDGGEWAGYIPTIRAATEGGYGAGYNTRIEVGAGEAIVDRAAVNLLKLAGILKTTPSQ